MARQWISDVGEREAVDEVYLVLRKTMPVARNGRPYLSLLLTDRTGQLDARIWDNVPETDLRFDELDFVRVTGQTIRFQDRIQLHIAKLQRVDGESLDPADFLARTGLEPEVLWKRTMDLLDTVAHRPLRALLNGVVQDEAFVAAYQRAPAGKSIHHARLGGLMEHNLSLCRLIDAVCQVYEEAYPGLVDRDLLIAAGFLHDVGKILELSTERRFEYTDAGRLVGHVVLGYEFVAGHLAAIPGFPEDLALHLKHLLLSHHGELEFGAAKRPKTTEAWILHFVDILDGRVAQMADLVGNLPPGAWTPYQHLYDRYLWRGHDRSPGEPGDPESPADPGSAEAS